MKSENALVFLYTAQNKYSYNALAGALETDAFFEAVEIYFPDNEKTLVEKLPDIVKKHNMVVLAISFMTPQLWKIASLVRKLRGQYGKHITLIAGGSHPSGDVGETLRMGFDVVARGEGEALIVDLLKQLYTDGTLQDVPGIAFVQDNGKIKFTGPGKPVDLDRFPPFAVKKRKIGPIEITRGCPFQCHYCQTGHLSGTKPRHRSIDCICENVDIMKRNRLTDIRVITPNAFSYGSPDGKTFNLIALENLLKNIRKVLGSHGRLFWGTCPSEVRPEHVTRDTIELILRYADNDNLVIGAQSGSQRLLDHCNRGHSVEDVYRAVEITIQAGLKANVDFIFGLPGETAQDCDQTIKVMKDLVEKGVRIHAHTFMPLPQTHFAAEPAKSMDDLCRKRVNYLASHGRIYGNWIRQETIAKRIESHFRNRRNIPENPICDTWEE
ncbi:MAG TPA: TIGR04013 family B12-binding domain/radical SAM domain-containing protein [Smithella sp.]|nr:TIGR04013 family B12-binding domain/radical SAM domain-containing protein [Smithella sp.]